VISLRLYHPVLAGAAFLEDISAKASPTWRRSTRRDGGYWRGSFTLTGERDRLALFFHERLGAHVEEKYGGFKTWEGMVYEMDLTLEGTTRRRSLDLLSNYVTSTYINTTGDINTSTAAQNETSIARYGRREELLTLDGYPQTASEKRRDTWLKENAWPWARPVGAGEAIGSDQLTVVVCGYVFTANWRYTAIGDGSIGYASTYISEMVESDCEFLSAGIINENTLGVKKEPSIPSRTYDVISEQAGLGDASGNPWRFYVDNDRRANYQMIDTTPVYYLRGGRLFASAGGSQEIVPWIVKPGVARDMNYPISRSEYGGWLPDARDFYIEEVEAGPGGLSLKTELFEESEILAAQQAYEQALEDAGTGSGDDRLNWKRKVGLTPDTPEWEEAVRLGKKAWYEKYRGK
jgi:hypothetical protein